MDSTCSEKLFGLEIRGWFLLSLPNWKLELFNWWWQKRFSRVWRRFSSLEWSNSCSISLDFVQVRSDIYVLLSKVDFQGFEKVRYLEKKCFFWNLTEKTLAIVVEIANYLCRAFLEQKQEAISFFGCRAKNLRLVLSNVLSNCPISFIEKFFADLQTFFLELWPLIWWPVLSKIYSRCAEEHFLEKSLSSKKWFERVRTMLSKVQFTSVEICFGKKICHKFEEKFFGWWTKVLPTCRATIRLEVFWGKNF